MEVTTKRRKQAVNHFHPHTFSLKWKQKKKEATQCCRNRSPGTCWCNVSRWHQNVSQNYSPTPQDTRGSSVPSCSYSAIVLRAETLNPSVFSALSSSSVILSAMVAGFSYFEGNGKKWEESNVVSGCNSEKLTLWFHTEQQREDWS